MKHILTILFFIISLTANSSLYVNSDELKETRKQHICLSPTFLHPDARALTERYSAGNLSSTVYLEQFIWLEPDLESYALCVICSEGPDESSGHLVSLPNFCNESFYDFPDNPVYSVEI